jgi:hypothetical protein
MAGSGGFHVHAGKADRTFAASTGAQQSGVKPKLNGSGNIEPLGVADVDGDGDQDIVGVTHLYGEGFQSAVSYLNNGSGSFGAAVSSVLGWQHDSALLDGIGSYFFDAADVDGDGRADIVAFGAGGSTYVFKGQANGFFSGATTAASINTIFDDGRGEEPVGLADLNADGRADLLTLDGTDLWLRLGNSDGTFAAKSYSGQVNSSLLDGTGEELVGLLDHNRDGRPDLISVEDDGDVRTYVLQANFIFSAPTTHDGSITTTRFDAAGHELVQEKPFFRRTACSASGCDWPPTAP